MAQAASSNTVHRQGLRSSSNNQQLRHRLDDAGSDQPRSELERKPNKRSHDDTSMLSPSPEDEEREAKLIYSGSIIIGKKEELTTLFTDRFHAIKQTSCKEIQQRVVGTLVPHKQKIYPYQQLSGTSSKKHRGPPDFWPSQVAWLGPDRLKTDRTYLDSSSKHSIAADFSEHSSNEGPISPNDTASCGPHTGRRHPQQACLLPSQYQR